MDHCRAQRYQNGFHVDTKIAVLLKGGKKNWGLKNNLREWLECQLADRPQPPKSFDVHFCHAEQEVVYSIYLVLHDLSVQLTACKNENEGCDYDRIEDVHQVHEEKVDKN